MLTDDGYRQIMQHARRLAQGGRGELAQHLRDAIDLRAEVEALKARIATRRDFARLLIQKDAMLDIAQGSLEAARAEVEALRSPVARPLSEWHEDMGDVLWWRLPVDEPPYCGQMGDIAWPGYHTHWTPLVVPSNAAQGGKVMSIFEDDMEAENKAIVEQHAAGWWGRQKDAEIDRLRAELKILEGLHFVAKCKLLSVTAENALLRADAERLDCGQIMISTLDEFGEPKQVWHTGMNLRAAIDAAMAAQSDGGKA